MSCCSKTERSRSSVTSRPTAMKASALGSADALERQLVGRRVQGAAMAERRS